MQSVQKEKKKQDSNLLELLYYEVITQWGQSQNKEISYFVPDF